MAGLARWNNASRNQGLGVASTHKPSDHKFTAQDEYVIEATAHVLSGLENNIIQKVVNPLGMLVGGHYPDAVASTAIEHVHRLPDLLGSATFKQAYDKFLRAVVAWDGKYQHRYCSPELMADIRAELDGNYILKSKFTPAAPRPAVPEISADAGNVKIRPCGRVRFRQYPFPSTEAQRFLDGNS